MYLLYVDYRQCKNADCTFGMRKKIRKLTFYLCMKKAHISFLKRAQQLLNGHFTVLAFTEGKALASH